MKKDYIKPAFQVIEMKSRMALLVGSERSLGVGSGTKSAEEALSRGGFFDEDEGEDY